MRTLLRMTGVIAVSLLVCILLLIIFFGNGTVEYRYSVANVRSVGNIILLALIIIALATCVFFRNLPFIAGRIKKRSRDTEPWKDKVFRNRCLIAVTVIFVLEEIIMYATYFGFGWDVSTVFAESLKSSPLANTTPDYITGIPDNPVFYFDLYPNNAFIACAMAAVNKASVSIGLSPGNALLILSTAGVSMSIFLVSRIVVRLTSSKAWAVTSLALSAALIGFLPWFYYPYSDTFGLATLTLALWSYVCLKKSFARWAAFAFFSIIGYFIKPTAVFFLAVALALGLLCSINAHRNLRELLRPMAGLALGCALAGGSWAAAVLPTGFSPDSNVSFTPTHYLMMGLNEKEGGGFSASDVGFSRLQPDKASREKADLDKAVERAVEMGPAGLAKLFAKKMLSAYNDGSFAWGQDKPFFPEDFLSLPDNAIKSFSSEEEAEAKEYFSEKKSEAVEYLENRFDNPLSQILTSYYFDTGRNYDIFLTIQQAIWLMVLLGVALCLMSFLPNLWRKTDPRSTFTVIAIIVSLATLTVFLMLFEVRARYLYLYVGFYIVAAVWGYRCLFSSAKVWLERRSL